MNQVNILGSTGSIGTSTLRIMSRYPDTFRPGLLLAGANLTRLKEQVEQFRPRYVSIAEPAHENELKTFVSEYPETTFLPVEEAMTVNCDIAVSAIVGTAGLVPTWHAIHHADRVALANKETLVAGGEQVMAACAKQGTELVPVDSEHSAVHQALRSGSRDEVAQIVLTASGGPFRGLSAADVAGKTAADALRHPTWNMGDKVTIDSATLMNKGLEVIEARFLFDVEYDRITVKVHPQSIVHSMVCFRDGSLMAQLGVTDMQLPILYALTYPDRLAAVTLQLNLGGSFSYEFMDPDVDVFKCLSLAYRAGRGSQVDRITLNAANEIAVSAFLAGRISFPGIADFVEHMLEKVNEPAPQSVADVAELDKQIKKLAQLEVSGGSF